MGNSHEPRSTSHESRATLYTNFKWGFTGEEQSMLVENGRVVVRGPGVGRRTSDSDAERVDLAGAWLMPKFIDEHCHILPTGLDLLKLHLGACNTHEEVLDKV